MKTTIFFCVIAILIACESKTDYSVSVFSNSSQIDTILISEQISDKILFRIPLTHQRTKRVRHKIAYTTIGSIQFQDGEQSYLTILHPKKELNIVVNSDSSIFNDDLADSLLNYLWKSNDAFIAEKANFIFTTADTDTIVNLFSEFAAQREAEIKRRASKLSEDEKDLLLFQNTTRIHSFLFYFGRLAKNFPANHRYFSFIKNIDNNTPWTKTLPHNLLYKHEINYLIEHDSIVSIKSFINYLSEQTENKDLLDFLKAIYISEIISSPSYWRKHERHLNPQTLQEIVAGEASNEYYDLIVKSSDSFFASQKGEKAFNFEAERMDGTTVKLSDLYGKVVFIDSWASWCGPCIVHRPAVIELAGKYKEDNQVEVLMISMDADRSDWLKYLNKNDQLDIEGDLIIENGMDLEFGKQFNVRQIPKYILIDKTGTIVNSNISEPSIVVEEMIEHELEKN